MRESRCDCGQSAGIDARGGVDVEKIKAKMVLDDQIKSRSVDVTTNG